MMTVFLTAAAMTAASFVAEGQSGAAVQPDPSPRPAATTIQTPVVRVILTDGSRGSMANTSIGAEPRHLWADASQCSIGAGSNSTFAAGTIAWRVSGRVVSQQGDTYTLDIDWARAAGGPASPEVPPSPRTITLRVDERVLIDRATVSGPCGGELRLEVMIGRPNSDPVVTGGGRGGAGRGGGFGAGRGAAVGGVSTTTGGRGGGGGAGAVMGGRGGAVTSTSTATVVGEARPPASAGVGRGGGRGGGVGAASTMPVPPGSVITLRPPNPPIDAELWLVYHPANPSEPGQVIPKTVPIGTPFAFSAVVVPTSQGPMHVEVSGSIYERLLNGAPDGLAIEIKRRIKGDGPPPIDNVGSSTQHLPMPGAADVVSFPIPNGLTETTRTSVAGADERRLMLERMVAVLPSARLLQGHTFELRLRIKTKEPR
jgi:hypothetical protein